MDQYSYETILACIHNGAPAIEAKLVAAFNQVMKLANERVQQQQMEQQIAVKKAQTKNKK